MNELQIFKNNDFGEIRTVELNDIPYFVGKDVAKILGYTNPQKALRNHIDEEDKTVNETFTVNGTMGVLINESGLYSLILSSKLPTAKKFKHWVTSEVLPTIRKHGAYMTPEKLQEVLINPDTMIQLCTSLKKEQEQSQKLQLENARQQQIIGELQPKANYVDVILNNTGLVTITQIAKDYGMSGTKMNKLLNAHKVQFKQSGQWLLYSAYHNLGYTHSKTIQIVRSDGSPDVKMETKWTQKGRLFLYDLLKDKGIVPIVEQIQQSA